MIFTQAKLESAIIELLEAEGCPHVLGEAMVLQPQEILTKLRDTFLPELISVELKITEIDYLTKEAI